MKLNIHTPIITASEISVDYSLNGKKYAINFKPPADIPSNDPTVRVLSNWLAIIYSLLLSNVEYFDEITTNFELSSEEITFFEKVIYSGMAEFRYVNNIPITTKSKITPVGTDPSDSVQSKRALRGIMLLNGGGKDGLTSALLLSRTGFDFDLYQRGDGLPQKRSAEILQKTPFLFKRQMDIKDEDKRYKGHKPSSAFIAITAVASAYMLGIRDVIASNETSANEPNLTVDGVEINHQYTKTLEFEKDFSALLAIKGINVRYFSLLRPLHELQIVKIFSQEPSFYNSFVSCNKAFSTDTWCMKCAKCAFLTLALNAISVDMARKVFQIDDSINTPELQSYIVALIDPKQTKPFECVGTLEECQIAAKLILNNPEIELSEELKRVFVENTKNITQDEIRKFKQSLQTEHNIPTEYGKVLELMKTILESD